MWKIPFPFVLLITVFAAASGFFLGSRNKLPAPSPVTGKARFMAPQNPASASATERANPALAGTAPDFEHSAAQILQDPNSHRRGARLYAAIETLRPEDLPSALQAASRLDPKYRNLATQALLAHWAEIAPAAASRYFLEQKHAGTPVLPGGSNPLTTWARNDPAAATACVLALPKDATRDHALTSIASAIALHDARAAAELLEKHLEAKAPKSGVNPWWPVMTAWCEQDFSGAENYVLSLQDRDLRAHLLGSLDISRSGASPQQFLQKIKALNEPQLERDMTPRVLSTWARADALGALDHALALPAGDFRGNMVNMLISSVSKDNVDAAQRLIERLPENQMRGIALGILVRNWIGRDPNAAIDYVKALPEGSTRISAIESVAPELAKNDVATAVALAELLPPEEQRNVMQQISHTWGLSDPRGAAEYFIKNPGLDDEKTTVLYNVVLQWSQRNPREVLSWAQSVPDVNARTRFISSAIAGLANADVHAAVKELASLPVEMQRRSVDHVAYNFACNDLQKALGWASSIPDADTRSGAFSGLLNHWAKADSKAAAQWLETVPPGKPRDEAVRMFSEKVADRDPPSAAAWAATIADKPLRQRTLESVAREWLRLDKTTASAWIQSAPGLNAESRRKLLERR